MRQIKATMMISRHFGIITHRDWTKVMAISAEGDRGAERIGPLLITIAAVAGWIWLGLALIYVLKTSDAASLGPGMAALDRFSALGDLPADVRAALATLCAPSGGGVWSLESLAADFAMWEAMVLAMMLPSAAPALSLSAREGRGAAASVLVIAGYLAIWTLFAAIMTISGSLLTAARVMTGPMGAMVTTLSATTLLAAGLYQFTPWKMACLTRCRFPAKLLGADRLTATGLFTRGIARGIDCLGCCWALMVAMLAVGVMNIIWMVGLTAVMSLEKLLPGDGIRRAIGIGLIVLAAAIFAQSPAGTRLLHLG